MAGDHSKIEVALRMLRNGKSPREVADAVGVSRSTIYEWRRKHLQVKGTSRGLSWCTLWNDGERLMISIDLERLGQIARLLQS